MNWILLVMAGIAAAVVAMLLGGALAPRTQTATRTLVVTGSMDTVYGRVREVDGPPRWCADLPSMHVTAEAAPHRLDLTLTDDDGRPMGAWQITLHPRPAGAESTVDAVQVQVQVQVRITETATVDNLVLRFVRSLGGNGARPHRFLAALAEQSGAAPDVRDG
jgi:hypothetical protein